MQRVACDVLSVRNDSEGSKGKSEGGGYVGNEVSIRIGGDNGCSLCGTSSLILVSE